MDDFKIPQRLKAPRLVTHWAGPLLWALVTCIVPASAVAQDLGQGFKTPNSVDGTLADTAERQQEGSLARFRARQEVLEAKTGLTFGVDNHT
jgi:hypothetical protein